MTPKLVVATSFPVHPPRGGGQARVAGLYGALARRGVAVDIVSLGARGARARTLQPAANLREIQVPRTAAHDAAEWQLQQRAGVPVGDLALALHHDLTPAYGGALATCAEDASAIVACHPFSHPPLAAFGGPPLVFEAQDVEFDLKRRLYADSPDGEALTATVRRLEAACCSDAVHVAVCSDADGHRLRALYSLDEAVIATVPNGADPLAVPYVDLETRLLRRRSVGLDTAVLAVFVGSWHGPNLSAIQAILHVAVELDGVRVVVVGSAGLAFEDVPLPGNVDLCGVVDDGFLRSLLSLAHCAVNPVTWGSGTNLKMFDYALAGVPLVSTTFGARGTGLVPDAHFLPAEPEQLPEALRGLSAEPRAVTQARVGAARELVASRFSWDRIAGEWLATSPLGDLLATRGLVA